MGNIGLREILLVLCILETVTLFILQWERLKPKSKRKAKSWFVATPTPSVKHHKRDEAYWQNRLEAARDGVVDAQREYRDTLEGYAKWQGDKAIEEAKQARDEWCITFNFPSDETGQSYYDPFADDDASPPSEPDNKLLSYLHKITDEDPE